MEEFTLAKRETEKLFSPTNFSKGSGYFGRILKVYPKLFPQLTQILDHRVE